jgi:hypothetical protein
MIKEYCFIVCFLTRRFESSLAVLDCLACDISKSESEENGTGRDGNGEE